MPKCPWLKLDNRPSWFILSIIERLAEAGHVGIAPDLYYREPSNLSRQEIQNRKEHLRATVFKDVNAALSHLSGWS